MMRVLDFIATLILIYTALRFGYPAYVYAVLDKAVREGGRYASRCLQYAARTELDEDAIKAVKSVVVYGAASPLPGAWPVVDGLKPQNVRIEITEGNPHGLNPPKIVVSIVNLRLDGLVTTFTIDGRPKATFDVAIGRPLLGQSKIVGA